jgi:hypothetical protein
MSPDPSVGGGFIRCNPSWLIKWQRPDQSKGTWMIYRQGRTAWSQSLLQLKNLSYWSALCFSLVQLIINQHGVCNTRKGLEVQRSPDLQCDDRCHESNLESCSQSHHSFRYQTERRIIRQGEEENGGDLLTPSRSSTWRPGRESNDAALWISQMRGWKWTSDPN